MRVNLVNVALLAAVGLIGGWLFGPSIVDVAQGLAGALPNLVPDVSLEFPRFRFDVGKLLPSFEVPDLGSFVPDLDLPLL